MDSLIESIIEANSGQNETKIALSLGYNAGYFAQLRSREKRGNGPQVSAKLMERIKQYKESLQNAKTKLPKQDYELDPTGVKKPWEII